MIEKCTVKIDTNHPHDAINILIRLTKIYTDWLDYEANKATSIIECISGTTDSEIDKAIKVFQEHFGEYVTLKIT
tara:strand:- start:210 stop:434 length:225 start_codon:yes stop_codon:yes gene_type:complete